MCMLADVTLDTDVLGTLELPGCREVGLSMREQAVFYTTLDCVGSQAPTCLQSAGYAKICFSARHVSAHRVM